MADYLEQPGQQGLAYAVLAPLAVLAVLVWLPQDRYVLPLSTVFAMMSALLVWVFARDLTFAAYGFRRWLYSALAAVLAAVLAVYLSVSGVVSVLLVLWLLRLWYIRQYHLQRGRVATVEILRRCLLIALWSHLSVLTALLSPYHAL
jgi:hypothetical protein